MPISQQSLDVCQDSALILAICSPDGQGLDVKIRFNQFVNKVEFVDSKGNESQTIREDRRITSIMGCVQFIRHEIIYICYAHYAKLYVL